MISIKLAKGMLVKGRGDEQTQKLTAKSDQRKAALKRRMRTNRMLVMMVLAFLICWTPSVSFNFLRDFDLLPEFVKAQEYLFGLCTHLISIRYVYAYFCWPNNYQRDCPKNNTKQIIILFMSAKNGHSNYKANSIYI